MIEILLLNIMMMQLDDMTTPNYMDGIIDEIGFYDGHIQAAEEMINIIKEDYPEILEEYDYNQTNPFQENISFLYAKGKPTK